MNELIDLFAALGDRLRCFGDDERTKRVIAEACRANGWFTPKEVQRAVAAISDHMLRRERLAEWLAPYPVPVAAPRRVLVVMAGNIPLVGFFDLLCVVASGHRCLVKPSSKDTVLVEYIVDLLHTLDPDIPVSFYDSLESLDAVIATGGDNAVRHFRTHYAGIPSLLRGSRQSVAVLSGHETTEQLMGLADDIWAYSGLGCRNVSLVFLPQGCELALTPPATLNDKYRSNYRQTRALMTMTQEPFLDFGAAVAVSQRSFPATLSQISYTHYSSLEQVGIWLAEHDAELQCVVTACLPHSRRVGFGCAQSPALTDYPDARDVVAWLAALE